MAKTFNLTAQLNLAGPNNIKPIINNIRQQLGNISVGVNVKINPSTVNAVANFDKKLKSLNTTLVQINATAAGLTSTLKQLGSAFNSFNAAGNAAKQITASARALKQVQQNSKGATTEMQEFGKQAALAVRRFTAFSLATGAIFGVVGALKSGLTAAINFDKEMVKLSQVTGLSVRNLGDVANEVTRLSTTLGVSSEELINVATTLAQAGLSAKDTKIALEALAKSSLAPSFKDINETTEASIAIMAQFGIKAKDLEGVLGSVNAVSAAFAVEAEDITAAIRRAGGVFATAAKGISAPKDALNEFIAIFSSVRATTRESAETIATGLRTIFTRIQRGSTIELLKKFGVELTDLEGKFVGPYEAVNRLSEALNRIDPRDTQFSQIIEELGGFRQISKVIPLIQQVETRTQALGVAQKGSTSLTEAAATAQQSLANQFAKVREQFLAFIRSVSETSSFKTIIGLTLQLASGLISVAEAAKPLIPLLAVVGAVKGFSAFKQITTGFFSGLKGGGVGTAAANGAGAGKGPGSSGASVSNTVAVNQNTYAIQQLTASIQRFSNIRFGTPYPIGASSPLPRKFARGGLVPGSGSGDTVPAMLAPGEFVLRKSAVQSIGSDSLHKANSFAGGGKIDYKAFRKAAIAKKEQEKNAKIASDTYYLDGSQFAGVFLSGGPSVIDSVNASAIKKTGSTQLNSQLKNLGVPLNDKGVPIKSGIRIVGRAKGYNVKEGAFKDNIGKLYDNIEKDISRIVSDELGSTLSSPSIISTSLKSQKASISGSIFEAAFKGVTGNNTGLFLEDGKPVFDFEPSGRDKSAKFEALLGPTDIKSHRFADAKINGSPENLASIYGKALASDIKLTKKMATGGPIGGSGTGDTVPAMLTPGEFVINKKAADSIGRDTLSKMNSGRVGKFASGGAVGLSSGAKLAALGGTVYIAQMIVNESAGSESPLAQGLGGAIGGATTGAFLGNSIAPGVGGIVGAVLGGLLSGITSFTDAIKQNAVKTSLEKLTASVNKAEQAFNDLLSGNGSLLGVNSALGSSLAGVGPAAAASRNAGNGQLGATDFVSSLPGAYWSDNKMSDLLTKQYAQQDKHEAKLASDFSNIGKIASDTFTRSARTGNTLVTRDETGVVLTKEGQANEDVIKGLSLHGQQGVKTVSQLLELDRKAERLGLSSDEVARRRADIFKVNGAVVAITLQELADKERVLAEAYRNSAKELVSFVRIFSQIGAIAEHVGTQLDVSNQALDVKLSNLTGNGAVGGRGNSLSSIIGNRDAFSKEEFGSALGQLGNVFGAQDNNALGKTIQFARGGKALDEDLVKIISDSLIEAKREVGNPNTFEEPEGGDTTVAKKVEEGVAKLGLPKELSTSITKVISAELAGRQGSTFEDIISQFKNSDKFAETIPAANEALEKLTNAYDKAIDIFTQNTNKLVGLKGLTASARDKSSIIRASNAIELSDVFGKNLSADALNNPIQTQLTNLGGGITDPTQLLAKFNALQDSSADLEKRRQALPKDDIEGFKTLSLAATDTAVQINRTKAALELLADGTKKAAIQSKLAEEQSKRETQRGVLGGLATAGPQQIFQLMRDTQAFSNFKQTGQINGFAQAQGIDNFVQKFAGLLDKDDQATLQADIAKAQFKALGGDKLPPELAKLLQNALTKQGEAPEEQKLIQALQDVQKSQQVAADALVDIAAKAENVYGKQIVEQLTIFVANMRAELGGVKTPTEFALGGMVYASGGGSMFKPRGTDTVPAMLTPGEFVVNARSAATNRDLLEQINTGYFAGGGSIKEIRQRLANKGSGDADLDARASAAMARLAERQLQRDLNKTPKFSPTGTHVGQRRDESFLQIKSLVPTGGQSGLFSRSEPSYPGAIGGGRYIRQEGEYPSSAVGGRLVNKGGLSSEAIKLASTSAGGTHGYTPPQGNINRIDTIPQFKSSGHKQPKPTRKFYLTQAERESFSSSNFYGNTPADTSLSNQTPQQIAVELRAGARGNARRARTGTRSHFAKGIRRADGGGGRYNHNRYYADGGSVGGSSGAGGYDNFVKAVQSLGTYTDKLAAIRIPETITLTATIKPVQIVFSGENALALAVVEQMKGQLSSMIFSAMKAHINPLTGETNEGSINPSQISNRV